MKCSSVFFRERAYELAGEGIRDSDLRRWKLSHTLLNREEYGITGKRLLTRVSVKSRLSVADSATEIEINGSLEQNPNW